MTTAAVALLKNALPDAHRIIFEFHNRIALDEEGAALADYIHEANYIDVDDDYYFDTLYGCGMSDDEKKQATDYVNSLIDESSVRYAWLAGNEYLVAYN